jgi:hypothetical protein
MERPQSIIWFDRLYLGQIALGLLNTVMNWGAISAQVAASPGSELLPRWFMGATIALGVGIGLALWYFIARRGSPIAKWILTVIFLIGMLGSLVGLSQGNVPPTLNLIGIAAMVMHASAVFMLFRRDAQPWFAN